MINDYKEKIETQKEVLSSLPRNNNKNEKLYVSKVSELYTEYNTAKEVVKEEISKRRERYLQLEHNSDIDNLTNEINLLLPLLPLHNKYSSPYEKSSLDIVLYELGHFYKNDLEKVNNDIIKALGIFSQVGINLTEEDFNYSYYCNKYMHKFISQDVNKEELSKYFEEYYWQCPDIITHITLNFKYLYYKNKKVFDTYYDNQTKDLISKKIIEKYNSLYIERENNIRNSAYLLQEKFLKDELNINDYTIDKVSKAYKFVVEGSQTEKINKDILKLYYSVEEYKYYLDLDYIIKDIKDKYKEKDKYKNIYNTKKKEIDKLEKNLFKENKNLSKLIIKKKENKVDILNSKINTNINNLKNLYEELEDNYFLDKISTLEDNATIYDMLLLASSNYNYLSSLLKEKDKDNSEIDKLNNFVNNPHNNILNNILIMEDKDIGMLIMDRYNLFGFDLTKEKLDKDNIDNLIKELLVISNNMVMQKEKITEKRIKFIKETRDL